MVPIVKQMENSEFVKQWSLDTQVRRCDLIMKMRVERSRENSEKVWVRLL